MSNDALALKTLTENQEAMRASLAKFEGQHETDPNVKKGWEKMIPKLQQALGKLDQVISNPDDWMLPGMANFSTFLRSEVMKLEAADNMVAKVMSCDGITFSSDSIINALTKAQLLNPSDDDDEPVHRRRRHD